MIEKGNERKNGKI